MPEMTREQQRERVRRRVRAAATQGKYSYFPQKENTDYVKPDQSRRVSIYVRVSTDDLAQDTSLELQQKYYMDMLLLNYGRSLAKIYHDEGNTVVNESGAEMEENPDA